MIEEIEKGFKLTGVLISIDTPKVIQISIVPSIDKGYCFLKVSSLKDGIEDYCKKID